MHMRSCARILKQTKRLPERDDKQPLQEAEPPAVKDIGRSQDNKTYYVPSVSINYGHMASFAKNLNRERERERDRETDKHTDQERDKQIDRQTDGQTDKQT